jgi:hypothetical protein
MWHLGGGLTKRGAGGFGAVVGVACAMFLCRAAAAQEAVAQEEAPPSSVHDSAVPIDRAYEEAAKRVAIRDYIRQWLKEQPPFIRDTQLSLYLRSFYLYRDGFDDSLSEAWAVGGGLTYKSGYLLERFAIGAAVYTSQPVHAPGDRDGTLLLEPGQEGYTVVGQLYGELRVMEGVLINAYRQAYNTPYINRNDNRMTPNTFEGYSITGRHGGQDGAPEITWGAGYIAKIKERNSDEFVWLSQDAGATVKRGAIVAGGRYTVGDFSAGLVDYYSEDIINIAYAEGKYARDIAEGLGILFAAQFTHQASTGDNLLTGSSFSTSQFGFKTEASWGGALFSAGYTYTDDGAAMRSPWSSYPGYTSVQVQDFNRAGEQAVILKGIYDFSKVGLQGVTFYALWVYGWDRDDGPNESEVDLDLQWRPSSKSLEGLSFRVRWAYVEQRGVSDGVLQDFRFIVNWDF